MTTEYTQNFALALPDFRMGPWHDLLNDDIRRIDAIIYGALASLDTPTWANDTDYEVGQTVVDAEGGTTWMCNFDHTSPPTGTFADFRTANPTFWVQLIAGFAPRGEWANSTQYRPYDLAYESATGIFAQCKDTHVSNVSGTIEDDAVHWYWIVNFSSSELGEALTVSYVPTSPITGTNVQVALDELAGFVIALNSVNVTQGNEIDTLQTEQVTQDGRLTSLENADTTLDTRLDTAEADIDANAAAITAANAASVKIAGGHQIDGGFSVLAHNLGNITSFQVNPWLANYQYGNNVGAFTITAANKDGGVDFMITNGSGAGAISFSGFTVDSSNVGDALTTTNGHKFLISTRRIGGTSTYAIKALQA